MSPTMIAFYTGLVVGCLGGIFLCGILILAREEGRGYREKK